MLRGFLCLLFILLVNQIFGQIDFNLDSLLHVAHKKQIDKAKIEANLELFLHYEYEIANDKLARKYLDTVQILLEKYPNAEIEVRYNRIVGSYFCLASNYELGIEYLQKNVTYYENIGDELKLAIAKFKMANHLQDLGNDLGGHAASSRIDQEVLPVFIKYNDNYNYCGVLAEELYNFPEDGAAIDFRKAANFCVSECTKFENWYNEMYAYDAMLKMYYTRHYFTDEEANILLKKIEAIAQKDPYLDIRLLGMYWQSPVFFKQKRYDLALETALKYQNLAKSPTQITQNKEIFDIISKSYQAKGDFAKAIHYKDSVLIYSDRIAENRNENAAFALEMKYRSERSKMALQEAKTKQNYLIGSLYLLLVLASFIYYQSNQKTIANKRLSISYAQIEKQKNQLQLLMRELHHRVKNNLQLITSLMSIQSLQTDDEKTKIVLQEGKQRVESINMIHQRLYKDDNISKVDFETYIKDLVEKNIRAYHYNYDTLQTDICIEDNLLSPDECIPLGLIVNELLTNSFKYAFPNVKKPTLYLHLKRYNNEQLKLEYTDNGEGLGNIKIDDIPSFGLNLIKMLSQQLDGNYTFESNNGLQFELIFKRSAS